LTDTASRTQILAIHNGPGSAYPYVPLTLNLGRGQPFYAMRQSEFGQPVVPFRSTHAMPQACVGTASTLPPVGSYVFAGMCSAGAYVTCETTQQAAALGKDSKLFRLYVWRGCARVLAKPRARWSGAQDHPSQADADVHRPILRAKLVKLLSAASLEPQCSTSQRGSRTSSLSSSALITRRRMPAAFR
jgi:hypothetical protein